MSQFNRNRGAFGFRKSEEEEQIEETLRRVEEEKAARAAEANAPVHIAAGPEKPGGNPSALYVQRTSSRVRIFTPSGVIEGEHHHAEGVRLSDALRNQVVGEKYMLLTNVTMHSTDGEDLGSSAFVLIRTEHASVVVPLDEQEAA